MLMLMLVDGLVFVGAASAAGYAIYATAAPNWARIADALTGRSGSAAVLEPRIRAERRAAVRRWAGSPQPARLRAAA